MNIKTVLIAVIFSIIHHQSLMGLNFDVTNKESILRETNINSKVLVVTFGGLHHRFVMPMFEFYNILKPFNVKKLFVRDMYQCWYQRGISENGNITKTCAILRDEIQKANVDKVVFFGNSSGAYAALLFGRLLLVDEAHAFVPQTVSGASIPHYEYREPEYFDLPTVFSNNPNPKTKFHIYYSDDNPNDIINADRLRGDNIIHHVYKKKGGHTMVTTLRNEKILHAIIREAVSN